jgi:hypothetical protein
MLDTLDLTSPGNAASLTRSRTTSYRP